MSTHIFVSGYGTAEDEGIKVFSYDQTTGALAKVGGYTGIGNTSFLAAHPNGRWIYTTGENHNGSIWALSYDRTTWAISPINHQPSGGSAPCHLLIDATSKWLLAANYTSGSALVLPIREDGSLGEQTSFVQHSGASGVNPQRQEGPHAHSTILSPDNRFAIVADLGLDRLMVYRFDDTKGTLTPHAQIPTPPGSGPRHTTFHPNGQHLYVGNELDSTVTVFDYDAENGGFSERQTIPTLPAPDANNTVADIHFSPDGTRLYVSNRGHDSIAVFAVNADGSLTSIGYAPSGGRVPRNFAPTADGRYVLVANQESSLVSVLPVQAEAPGLGAPISQVEAVRPACIVFV